MERHMIRPGFFTRTGIYRTLEGTPAHPLRRAVRIGLAILILLNVAAVIIESVESLSTTFAGGFRTFELLSVAIFSLEYGLRIWVCVEDPRYGGRWGRLRFAFTPLALIDLLAVLPFFLQAFLSLDIRMLRAFRLLRIFKLSRHSSAMDLLLTVIRQEASSILSAMSIMLIVVILAASGIYMIERESNPEAFDSIPKAMWWASVTLTTVGYGDVVPQTVLGKVFGLLITITGVGMVALPAGILASGYSLELHRRRELFRLQLKGALADGDVSRAERQLLESQRNELGLSEAEAQVMISTEQAEYPKSPDTCPHCGKPLLEQR